MVRNDDKNVVMEGVRLIFRNFSGKEGQYNREGDRNFAVLLDPKTAKEMEKDGWNVKVLNPREEGDEPQPYLTVAVNYKGRPPRVVLITSHSRTNLTEDTVGTLDWADIINADLIVRPYEWAVSGKTGVKAYLQSLYVTIQEDPLEAKYADVNPAADLDNLPFR